MNEKNGKSIMSYKMIVKISVDIAMTVALLLLMAYQLIGDEAHEWIGIIMFVLFVLHHILNMAWSRNVLKGKYNARRMVQTLLVVLILLCMCGSMVSGIILSRYVFAPLNIQAGMSWARSVHMLCAYWGFVFMSIHLGLHWNMIIAMARKAVARKQNNHTKVITVIMRIIAVAIAVYGMFAFVKRDIWNYMILKNHFAFFDFSEPVIFFILDYLAVMGLFVFVGHYLGKCIQGLDKKNFTMRKGSIQEL